MQQPDTKPEIAVRLLRAVHLGPFMDRVARILDRYEFRPKPAARAQEERESESELIGKSA
jgi:hypothetical protein